MTTCAHKNRVILATDVTEGICVDCLKRFPTPEKYVHLYTHLIVGLPEKTPKSGTPHTRGFYQVELPFVTPAERRELPQGAWEE